MTITFDNTKKVSVEENSTGVVLNLEARIDDGLADIGITYSITDVAGLNLFTINSRTGELSFNSVQFPSGPDYEDPKDHGSDNNYDVIVTATNTITLNTETHTLKITVTDEIDVTAIDTADYAPAYNLAHLNGENGFVTKAFDEREYNGWSVSNAGDINGDGIDDLAVGAFGFTWVGGVFKPGLTYVIFGTTNGFDPVLFPPDALDGTNGFSLYGIDQGDFSGSAVSNAGDVNGDGIDDLLIGAYGADQTAGSDSREGETYVVYGRDNGFSSRINLASLDGNNGFTIKGEGQYSESGQSVSSAGDVNGDGCDDILIWASTEHNSNKVGEAYVVFGGANLGASIELSALGGGDGFKLTSVGDISGRYGKAVADAGDINGDGYGDIIIGAAGANSNAGETYVVFGKSGGFDAELDLASLSSGNGSEGFILKGIDNDDRSGLSVSGAGDVNGDGYGDLIIGAYRGDPNGGDSGETYVVFGNGDKGAFGTGFSLSSLDGNNGFTINGHVASDRSGFSVASAGDVNGDGYDDLIIGARTVDTGLYDEGASYVVFGKSDFSSLTDGKLNLVDLNGSNGFALNGFIEDGQTGWSVSGAGDINGDGYDDMVIGAPRTDLYGADSGQTYVIFGGPALFQTVIFSDASVSVTEKTTSVFHDIDAIYNGGAADTIRYSISGDDAALFTMDTVTGALSFNTGPDYDRPQDKGRDNQYELTVTASSGTNANKGDSDTQNLTITVTEQAVKAITSGYEASYDLSDLMGKNGFTIRGIAEYDLSGYSVSDAGDVNGDGYDDVIIGAYYANSDTDKTYAGASYVVFGKSSGFASALDLASLSAGNGADGFIIKGIAEYDHSGASVSSAGDINGDGYDDLIIGAPGVGEYYNGASYVVFGKDSGFGTGLELSSLASGDGSAGFVLNNLDSDTLDNSGRSVSSAGDINGDGLDDLIIGAYGVSSFAGETYVVFGSTAANAFGSEFSLGDLSSGDGSKGFVLRGDQVGDNSGRSVSSAGDINDDGYDDLIIGAAGANSHAGETYVVFGKGSGLGSVIELSGLGGNNGFTVKGISGGVLDSNGLTRIGGDYSGWSVSSAGDVNGDGYADLIIGAWGVADLNDNSNVGESYIVFGKSGGFDPIDLATLSPDDGLVIKGHVLAGESGFSVSDVGDFNGDGIDDLIIGAKGANNAAGESYVVFGSTSLSSINLADLDGSNGFALNGIDPDDRSGRSVSGARDVNGDGYDDIIIGAINADRGVELEAGESYVIFGGPSLLRIDFDNADTVSVKEGSTGIVLNLEARLDGAGPDEGITYSISSNNALNFTIDAATGELHFDPSFDESAGTDYDVTITATSSNNNNLNGSHSLTISVNDQIDQGVEGYAPSYELSGLNGSNGFVLNGIGEYDSSGGSVSSAGDVNGDGIDDIIVGAYRRSSPRTPQIGESYVVFGSRDANGFEAAIELSSLDGSNGFVLKAVDIGDYSGRSVAGAGDINGDGYSDIIISSYRAEITNIGETYVVFGFNTDGTAAIELSSLDGHNGFKLNGIDDFDNSGRSVSSAGDVNGDGYGDLIIGASKAEGNDKRDAGESYVVFGKAGGFSAAMNLSSLDGSDGFKLNGIDASDFSGISVSTAGDVNGDGYDDIIIGAHQADPNDKNAAGETYVVYGQEGGFDAVLDLSSLDGSDGFKLNGIDGNDRSGRSVSSAGDLNGDGYDDLIIGAYRGDPNGGDSGESYIVFGDAGLSATIELSGLDGSDGFALRGIDAGDRSGFSVSSAGDVNGDGYGDLIIGAYKADPNDHFNAGESYVVFGGASFGATIELSSVGGSSVVVGGASLGATIELSNLNGSNGFVLNGQDQGDNSGNSVSTAGDVNGDGYDDIIIGAKFADPNNIYSAGKSYVIFGGPALISNASPPTPTPTPTPSPAPTPTPVDHSVRPTADLTASQTTPTPNDDFLEYGLEDNAIYALPGDDYADGGNGDDTIGGGPGNDTLEGGNHDDLLLGWLGDDLIFTRTEVDPSLGDGNNVVWAGPGDDTVIGANGNDTLGGGDGDDSVTGGSGDDIIYGGDGDDNVSGDQGSDTIYGFDGDDHIDGGAGSDIIISRKGADTVLGGDGDDMVWGGLANDQITGHDGNDTLGGGHGSDTIAGGLGSDVIFNGFGDDTVNGGSGADTLWGGFDDDQLTGGAGADSFRYTLTGGNDHITDFDLDEDIFDLTETGITGLDTLASTATDTADGLLVTLSEDTSVLFTGLNVSDLSLMTITFTP